LYNNFKENELRLAEGLSFQDTSYTFYQPDIRGPMSKLSNLITFLFDFHLLYFTFEKQIS